MSSIFLSHSGEDKPFARKLAASLRGQGVKVWLDEAEIRVGDSLIDKISEGIQGADYLGVLLSRHSNQSPWVKLEVKQALHMEIHSGQMRVLPLLLDDSTVPLFLQDKLYADFRDESRFEETARRLGEQILAGPASLRPIDGGSPVGMKKLLRREVLVGGLGAIVLGALVLSSFKPGDEIGQVRLHGEWARTGKQVPPNTLDDLILTWTYQGRDSDLKILLRERTSGQVSRTYLARMSDLRLRVPAESLEDFWQDFGTAKKYPVAAEFTSRGGTEIFGPFEVEPAIEILYMMGQEMEVIVAAMDGRGMRISHSCAVNVLAWPLKGTGWPSKPEAVDVQVINGRGEGRFPDGFLADSDTLECVYLGNYPAQLVRYRNAHTE